MSAGPSWLIQCGGPLVEVEVEVELTSLSKLDLDPANFAGETLAVLLVLKMIFSISSLLTIPRKISSKLGEETENDFMLRISFSFSRTANNFWYIERSSRFFEGRV